MLFVGLISGTSIDGIDAALVRCEAHGTPELLAGLTHAYPCALAQRLRAATQLTSISYAELCELDTAVAASFADAALELIRQSGARTGVTAIGSHGQTLFHHPEGPHPNSLQIGNPSVIARRTGLDTIADFRRADMACGGQGAPLLPALHQRLFTHPETTRAVLNLGGIANLSVLPAGATAPSAGFDTGPANTLLDAWVNQSRGLRMDEGAQWSSSGRIIEAALAAMLSDPYFDRAPPKSTGVEYFNLAWVKRIVPDLYSHAAQDVARTLVRLSAVSAARAVNATAARELYAVGGGAHNPLLMRDLSELCAAEVKPAREAGVDVDYLEAMAFAWFARCYLDRVAVISPALTGARHAAVLGALYPAERPA